MDKSSKENIKPQSESKSKKEVKFEASNLKSKKESCKKSAKKDRVVKDQVPEREVLAEKKVPADNHAFSDKPMPSFIEQEKSLSVIDEKPEDGNS